MQYGRRRTRGRCCFAREIGERAPASHEHAVWLEPREVCIDALLAGFLHAQGCDRDLRAARACTRHRASESDELHPVELDLRRAGIECCIELRIRAAQRHDVRRDVGRCRDIGRTELGAHELDRGIGRDGAVDASELLVEVGDERTAQLFELGHR